MKKLIVLAFVLGACAGDDDGGAVRSCDEFSAEVSQRRGSCVMAVDEPTPFGDLCPFVVGALCGGDGDPTKCPTDGWGLGCDGPEGSETNCTYFGSCTELDSSTVEFDFIQRLDGVDGIAVVTGNACEFRPCD